MKLYYNSVRLHRYVILYCVTLVNFVFAVICVILGYCNIITCLISHFCDTFFRNTKCTCMYVCVYVCTYVYFKTDSGLWGQFLALIIVYNNHKNIQMLHIHLMVVCRNGHGHRHNESALDLSTVPSLHYHKIHCHQLFQCCAVTAKIMV